MSHNTAIMFIEIIIIYVVGIITLILTPCIERILTRKRDGGSFDE